MIEYGDRTMRGAWEAWGARQMTMGFNMQDTFPVCGGLGHDDPLALLKFCQFSRGDVSTWIIFKGETTTWGLTRPGWEQGLRVIFWEFCGIFSKVGLMFKFNCVGLFLLFFIF